jgi:pyridoxal biosynthesis lyase PdxS
LTLLPVNASDALFHFKEMRLLEGFDVEDSDGRIITASNKFCHVRRPTFSPKLAFVMGCHNRLRGWILLGNGEFIDR